VELLPPQANQRPLISPHLPAIAGSLNQSGIRSGPFYSSFIIGLASKRLPMCLQAAFAIATDDYEYEAVGHSFRRPQAPTTGVAAAGQCRIFGGKTGLARRSQQ
jgi:hypothetical protein